MTGNNFTDFIWLFLYDIKKTHTIEINELPYFSFMIKYHTVTQIVKHAEDSDGSRAPPFVQFAVAVDYNSLFNVLIWNTVNIRNLV